MVSKTLASHFSETGSRASRLPGSLSTTAESVWEGLVPTSVGLLESPEQDEPKRSSARTSVIGAIEFLIEVNVAGWE